MRLDDGRVIPNFLQQAIRKEQLTIYGTGNQTRSFCYVSDLIRGIYALALSSAHEPVNIGNPHEMTIVEMAQLIIKLSGSKSILINKPLPVDDPKVRQPDISLAKKLLDWEPQVPVEEGVRRTIECFRTVIN